VRRSHRETHSVCARTWPTDDADVSLVCLCHQTGPPILQSGAIAPAPSAPLPRSRRRDSHHMQRGAAGSVPHPGWYIRMLVSDAAQSTSQMDAPHGGSRHEATLPVLRASPWAQRRSSPADCARPRAYRREATRVFRGRAAAVWPPPWWGLSLSLRRCFPALPWRWRPPPLPSHGHRVCPRKGADDVGHRICARSACVHHTTSAGPAVRVSLVKPGADLSASSDRDNAPALPAVRGI
jgi:hypothetical protein